MTSLVNEKNDCNFEDGLSLFFLAWIQADQKKKTIQSFLKDTTIKKCKMIWNSSIKRKLFQKQVWTIISSG